MNKRTRILFLTILVYMALLVWFLSQFMESKEEIWLIPMASTALISFLVAHWRERQWIAVARPVIGVIREVTTHSNRGQSYYRYQVEYEHGGTTYTHTYEAKSSSQVGSLEPLLMHPMRPSDVRGPSEKWMHSIVWGVLAGVGLFVACFAFYMAITIPNKEFRTLLTPKIRNSTDARPLPTSRPLPRN